MADALNMKQLIWNCQQDIAEYLPDESGITEHDLLQMLIARLDGSRRRKRLETIGKDGGRMMMTAVAKTLPFPSSRYRSRPEIGQLLQARPATQAAPRPVGAGRCSKLLLK